MVLRGTLIFVALVALAAVAQAQQPIPVSQPPGPVLAQPPVGIPTYRTLSSAKQAPISGPKAPASAPPVLKNWLKDRKELLRAEKELIAQRKEFEQKLSEADFDEEQELFQQALSKVDQELEDIRRRLLNFAGKAESALTRKVIELKTAIAQALKNGASQASIQALQARLNSSSQKLHRVQRAINRRTRSARRAAKRRLQAAKAAAQKAKEQINEIREAIRNAEPGDRAALAEKLQKAKNALAKAQAARRRAQHHILVATRSGLNLLVKKLHRLERSMDKLPLDARVLVQEQIVLVRDKILRAHHRVRKIRLAQMKSLRKLREDAKAEIQYQREQSDNAANEACNIGDSIATANRANRPLKLKTMFEKSAASRFHARRAFIIAGDFLVKAKRAYKAYKKSARQTSQKLEAATGDTSQLKKEYAFDKKLLRLARKIYRSAKHQVNRAQQFRVGVRERLQSCISGAVAAAPSVEAAKVVKAAARAAVQTAKANIEALRNAIDTARGAAKKQKQAQLKAALKTLKLAKKQLKRARQVVREAKQQRKQKRKEERLKARIAIKRAAAKAKARLLAALSVKLPANVPAEVKAQAKLVRRKALAAAKKIAKAVAFALKAKRAKKRAARLAAAAAAAKERIAELQEKVEQKAQRAEQLRAEANRKKARAEKLKARAERLAAKIADLSKNANPNDKHLAAKIARLTRLHDRVARRAQRAAAKAAKLTRKAKRAERSAEKTRARVERATAHAEKIARKARRAAARARRAAARAQRLRKQAKALKAQAKETLKSIKAAVPSAVIGRRHRKHHGKHVRPLVKVPKGLRSKRQRKIANILHNALKAFKSIGSDNPQLQKEALERVSDRIQAMKENIQAERQQLKEKKRELARQLLETENAAEKAKILKRMKKLNKKIKVLKHTLRVARAALRRVNRRLQKAAGVTASGAKHSVQAVLKHVANIKPSKVPEHIKVKSTAVAGIVVEYPTRRTVRRASRLLRRTKKAIYKLRLALAHLKGEAREQVKQKLEALLEAKRKAAKLVRNARQQANEAVKALRDKKNDIKTDIRNLKRSIALAEASQKEGLQAALRAAREQLREVKKVLRRVHKVARAARRAFYRNASVRTLKRARGELRAKKAELKSNIANLKAQIAASTDEIAKKQLKRQLKIARRQYRRIKRRLRSINRSIVRAKVRKARKLRAWFKAVNKRVAHLKAQLRKPLNDVDRTEIENKLAEAKEKLHKIKTKLKKTGFTVRPYVAKRSPAARRHLVLRSKLKEVKRELRAAIARVNHIKHLIANAVNEDEKEKHRVALEAAKEKAAAVRSKYRNIKTKVAIAKRQIEIDRRSIARERKMRAIRLEAKRAKFAARKRKIVRQIEHLERRLRHAKGEKARQLLAIIRDLQSYKHELSYKIRLAKVNARRALLGKPPRKPTNEFKIREAKRKATRRHHRLLRRETKLKLKIQRLESRLQFANPDNHKIYMQQIRNLERRLSRVQAKISRVVKKLTILKQGRLPKVTKADRLRQLKRSILRRARVVAHELRQLREKTALLRNRLDTMPADHPHRYKLMRKLAKLEKKISRRLERQATLKEDLSTVKSRKFPPGYKVAQLYKKIGEHLEEKKWKLQARRFETRIAIAKAKARLANAPRGQRRALKRQLKHLERILKRTERKLEKTKQAVRDLANGVVTGKIAIKLAASLLQRRQRRVAFKLADTKEAHASATARLASAQHKHEKEKIRKEIERLEKKINKLQAKIQLIQNEKVKLQAKARAQGIRVHVTLHVKIPEHRPQTLPVDIPKAFHAPPPRQRSSGGSGRRGRHF
jgi:chromosome segregation ATPase